MVLNWTCVLITRWGSSCTDHLPIVRAKTYLAVNHKKYLPCLVLLKLQVSHFSRLKEIIHLEVEGSCGTIH